MGEALQGNARSHLQRWRATAPRDDASLTAFFLLLFALGLTTPTRAQDSVPFVTQVGEVSVLAWGPQQKVALALGEMADQPAYWVGFGYRAVGRMRLVVVPDAEGMRRFSGGRAPAWGAGLAFPSSRLIVLRTDGGGDLRQTLRHELAHLVLHDAVRTRVPLWFDEGYAAVAANEWDRMDALRLSAIVLRRDIPGFRELDGSLRAESGAAEKAYTLAMSAVLELGRRNPAGTLDSLIGRLARGEDFDVAVTGSTGLTLLRFEADWQRSIKRRYNLVIWLSAGGFWLVITLAVAVAWWVRRRADRPRRRALDVGWEIDEDALQDDPQGQ